LRLYTAGTGTRERGDSGDQDTFVPAGRSTLVTSLEDRQVAGPSESALLGEAALAEDWDRPGEDEAWSHLPRASSSPPAGT
jgi:hypothetical protein